MRHYEQGSHGRCPARVFATAFAVVAALGPTVNGCGGTSSENGGSASQISSMLVPFLQQGETSQTHTSMHEPLKRYLLSKSAVNGLGPEMFEISIEVAHIPGTLPSPNIDVLPDECDGQLVGVQSQSGPNSSISTATFSMPLNGLCSLQFLVTEGAYEDAFWLYAVNTAKGPQLLPASGYSERRNPQGLEYVFSDWGDLRLVRVLGHSRPCGAAECAASPTVPTQAVQALGAEDVSEQIGAIGVDPEDLQQLFKE